VVGPLDRDPAFAQQLLDRVSGSATSGQVSFTGPRGGATLASAYGAADLLVAPTRLETYGMTVTEALAHGVPVIASDTGGVAEALGATELGRPGVLVPPGDDEALAAELGRWLTEPEHRARLRAAASARRETLPRWDEAAGVVAATVNRLRAQSVVKA
jgi:glycosyltransferase involved in cell wall biosynthesis